MFQELGSFSGTKTTRPNWARKVRELIIDVGQSNRRYWKVAFYIPEKGRRRKRRKIFEKGIRTYIGEQKQRQRKGGKYLEEENIFVEKRNGVGKRGKYLERGKVF